MSTIDHRTAVLVELVQQVGQGSDGLPGGQRLGRGDRRPEPSPADDIREQARNAFTNLKNVLEAAGSDLEHVVHLTQYFTNIFEVQHVDEVFAEFFPKNYPARTVIQISALVLPQLRLEVQARAILK